MIDLKAIRAANINTDCAANIHPLTVIAILDRLEAAEKDAARYRWLRDGNDHKDSPAMQIAINSYGCEWDEAIDAAMKEQK